MCGLAGEIRFDGRTADVAAVRADQRAAGGPRPRRLRHWARGPVALGHRRLSIIDLSARRRPSRWSTPDLGLTVVFNGCIYNYQQLRAELEGAGYRFFSTSDTEVILKAYAHWGPACVDHFLGMFAFAISSRDRTARAGPRPAGHQAALSDRPGDRLRFASTPAGAAGRRRGRHPIDPTALPHYMTFHSWCRRRGRSSSGVTKLPPATVRVIEADGPSAATASTGSRTRPRSRQAPTGPTRTGGGAARPLRIAVDRRMVADVPVGVLLSGGLDSSLVVALLAEAGQHDLNTFSIGFESAGGEPGTSSSTRRLVAERFETDHHQIPIASDRLLPGVDAAIGAMSEPMVSHDCVAFYLLVRRCPGRQGRAVRAGRRRGVRRLRLVSAVGRVPRTAPWRRTRRCSSTGVGPRWARS